MHFNSAVSILYHECPGTMTWVSDIMIWVSATMIKLSATTKISLWDLLFRRQTWTHKLSKARGDKGKYRVGNVKSRVGVRNIKSRVESRPGFPGVQKCFRKFLWNNFIPYVVYFSELKTSDWDRCVALFEKIENRRNKASGLTAGGNGDIYLPCGPTTGENVLEKNWK
jgi:hypothetical protein